MIDDRKLTKTITFDCSFSDLINDRCEVENICESIKQMISDMLNQEIITTKNELKRMFETDMTTIDNTRLFDKLTINIDIFMNRNK